MNRRKESIKRKSNPADTANFWSKSTFWWLRDLFRKGYRNPLYTDDLYLNSPTLDSAKLTQHFSELWQNEVENSAKPSILNVIYRVYGLKLLLSAILFCTLETGSKVVQIFSLGGLVSYFAPNQMEITRNMAWMYGAGIVVPTLVRCFVYNRYMLWTLFIGTRFRLACSGLIYRKILRLSKVVANDGLSGRAVNILSNDLGKMDMALTYVHDSFRGPVETLLYGWIMYREIGISAVIGVGFLLLFVPVQSWAARKTAYFRHRTAERSDIRVKLMNEIIQGIQVIKMYAWEKSFASVIEKIRQKEISAIRGTIYIQAALKSIFMVSGISVFLSLVSYVLLGDPLTAKKVFMVSSFFNALSDSFVYLWPQALTFFAEVYIATTRLRDFLMESEGKEDIKKDTRRTQDSNNDGKSITLNNATAYWNRGKDVKAGIAIKDFNITVESGELLAVIGAVGSGKSSLLNVILGELELDEGCVMVNGALSYACQEAWIFEATIRDNIVFIENFEEERYKEVVKVCALEKDFQLLPYGDQTIVGERGISLSGGQKARVNLARAIYKNADIYLLDDPLSAVDTHVGRHIFERCIRDYLRNKICVLVTHQLQFLKDVEKVILLNDGRIEAEGRFSDLQNVKELSFMGQNRNDESELSDHENYKMPNEDKMPVNEEFWDKSSKDKSCGRNEYQAEGSVGFEVYKSYFNSIGGYYIIVIVALLFLSSRTVLSGVDYFLSRWVNWEQQILEKNSTVQLRRLNNTSENVAPSGAGFQEERLEYVLVYSTLLAVAFVLFLSRTYAFFMMCLRMSLRLHDRLFRSITRATMQFFNNNSSGRILNRFSRDIYAVDTALPMAMLVCVAFFMDVTAILVIVGITNYWLFIPTFIILIVFYLIRKVYIKTSRSLKRIESITRSPLYSHTNQTFQGLATIRAFSAQDILEEEFHMHQNINTSAWYVFISANRALALWLDIVCILYISAVTFSFLLMENQFESGDVGLAIMSCINMVGMCQWGMRQTAEFENQMTSVERIVEYVKEPSEAALETARMYKPSAKWPEQGVVKFISVGMRYAEDKERILKGLNFEIGSSEKIGIVGRTGAGKSSIIQAMFRLAINEGVIEIDGVDINNLGLHDLRNSISIIPQDPVLFSGTLRYNLDPFKIRSDSEVWKALEDVELKNYVSKMDGGLDSPMSDGGSNFSMGQRQLVCLARAILRNNRILIMDEATANVDPETDKLIQNTIRTKFSECTVLTIAHRLQTVMDSDRILVMDGGQAVEMGLPYALLMKSDGYLRSLVDRTGSVTAAALTDIARNSSERKMKAD